MDFSDVEGLTEAQIASITAKVDAETVGLKSKNEQLLTEKKTVQGQYAEQEQKVADARAAAVAAEELRLKGEGDMEGLKKHYEEQLAGSTAAAKDAQRLAESRLERIHKDGAINQVLGGVVDSLKPFVRSQLESSIQISYNENNEASVTYTDDGNVVAASASDFVSWASGQDSWKAVLKGVDSSGAGSHNGGNSGAGTTTGKKYGDMSPEQKRDYLRNMNS